MSNRPTSAVIEMGKINFGDTAVCVIPGKWFQHIKAGKKTDMIGIMILSEITYWYRPSVTYDQATGAISGYQKRFSGDKLQKNARQLADKFGLSEKQCRDGIARLRSAGYISTEVRSVSTAGGVIPKVMFIDVNPEKIREITEIDAGDVEIIYKEEEDLPALQVGPSDLQVGPSDLQVGPSDLQVGPSDLQVKSYVPKSHTTKITTKITTEKEGEGEDVSLPVNTEFSSPSFSSKNQDGFEGLMQQAAERANGKYKNRQHAQLDELGESLDRLEMTKREFRGMVDDLLAKYGQDELANGDSDLAQRTLAKAQQVVLSLCEVAPRFRTSAAIGEVFQSWEENDWRDGLPSGAQLVEHAGKMKAGAVQQKKSEATLEVGSDGLTTLQRMTRAESNKTPALDTALSLGYKQPSWASTPAEAKSQ